MPRQGVAESAFRVRLIRQVKISPMSSSSLNHCRASISIVGGCQVRIILCNPDSAKNQSALYYAMRSDCKKSSRKRLLEGKRDIPRCCGIPEQLAKTLPRSQACGCSRWVYRTRAYNNERQVFVSNSHRLKPAYIILKHFSRLTLRLLWKFVLS